VLVVEDSPVNQLVMRHMLRRLGYRCEVADNGKIALDMLQATAGAVFDAVMMDIHMPVMDGIEATRAIRARGIRARDSARPIPILAVTASALQDDYEQSMASGMDDFLTKPVMLELLRAKLVHWIHERD
jgi:CheY-like chemotaxis protein